MRNDDDSVWPLSLIVLILFAACILCGFGLGVRYMREDAVAQGFAEYDTKTAAWRWKKAEAHAVQ